jgi:hypothetical protein
MRTAPTLHAPLLLIALAAGCSQNHPAGESVAADAAPQAAVERAEAGAVAPASPAPGGVERAGQVDPDALGSAAITQDVGTRRFIRTVNVDFQVPDVQRAVHRIEDLAARHGGFVTRSDVASDVQSTRRHPLGDGRLVELSVYVRSAQLQVRVPSTQAQAFVRLLAAEMDFLDRREYRAVDAQFELLRQELARARAAAAQRQLAQAAQRGGRTADGVMAIEAAADAALARDEALLAQKTFEDQVAFATIDLSMHQPERVRRSERPDVAAIVDREGPGFFRRAGAALSAGWSGLLEVALALLTLWPLWLGLGVVVIAWRAWRRASLRWRRAAGASTATRDEAARG